MPCMGRCMGGAWVGAWCMGLVRLDLGVGAGLDVRVEEVVGGVS